MLSIEGVSKQFGGLHAVTRCSFAVAEGSITGLIGPNGAGKTTVFNMVAGAFSASAGQIRFDGKEVTRLSAHQLFHQGLVRTFQIPHEFGQMTCLENLLLVPGAQNGERLLHAWFRWGAVRQQERALIERAEEVLEFIKMSHLRDTLAANVSGGQKKLLEIGRTMMTDARLVLLDEPGAGVNRTLLGDIVGLIRKLNQEHGYTFCIIEHDMGFIAELCDPVICMAEGTVLTQGTMAEVRGDQRVLEAYLGTRHNPADENEAMGEDDRSSRAALSIPGHLAPGGAAAT
ncbi:MAG: ABC transporter ATP-binding protein [Pseudomonadota bacterium]